MTAEKQEKKGTVRTRKREIRNQLRCEFSAVSANERLSRAMVSAMTAQLGSLSVDELADVRCAVSEAVTNAVVHAYGNAPADGSCRNTVYIFVTLYSDRSVRIVVRDRGCGISDVGAAMEPLYTTDTTGERSGMGFAIMQSFMDSVKVRSTPGVGTTVELRKRFAEPAAGAAGTDTDTAEPQAVSANGQEDIA